MNSRRTSCIKPIAGPLFYSAVSPAPAGSRRARTASATTERTGGRGGRERGRGACPRPARAARVGTREVAGRPTVRAVTSGDSDHFVVTDAERTTALSSLVRAANAGQVTLEEFSQRTDIVLATTTRSDLVAVTSD